MRRYPSPPRRYPPPPRHHRGHPQRRSSRSPPARHRSWSPRSPRRRGAPSRRSRSPLPPRRRHSRSPSLSPSSRREKRAAPRSLSPDGAALAWNTCRNEPPPPPPPRAQSKSIVSPLSKSPSCTAVHLSLLAPFEAVHRAASILSMGHLLASADLSHSRARTCIHRVSSPFMPPGSSHPQSSLSLSLSLSLSCVEQHGYYVAHFPPVESSLLGAGKMCLLHGEGITAKRSNSTRTGDVASSTEFLSCADGRRSEKGPRPTEPVKREASGEPEEHHTKEEVLSPEAQKCHS